MGELLFGLLQLVGFFAGKWLLPRLSGGLLIITPADAPANPLRLAPYVRLPDGRIGVDGEVFGALFAILALIALACCLVVLIICVPHKTS